MSQELDLELALARPNPEVQAFLRQAKSCGKKIGLYDGHVPAERGNRRPAEKVRIRV